MFRSSKKVLVLATATMCVLSGCEEAAVRPSVARSGDRSTLLAGHDGRVQQALADLYDEGEWNAVLNFDRLGRAALLSGDTRTAGLAFDAAIQRIDAVYADNPTAKKARSNWSSEAIKDFKGEPHERAMTYFYRGLVDLADGDFENARAAFKSADLQTTMSYGETYSSAFPTALWMAGWASQCNGQVDEASDYFARALEVDRSQPWSQDHLQSITAERRYARPKNRTLVIYERGSAPRKSGSGQYHEALRFEAAQDANAQQQFDVLGPGESERWMDGRERSADEQLAYDDSRRVGGGEADDLYGIAAYRGGRQVDSILAGKANFKSTAQTAGEIGMNVGMQAMQQAQLTNNRDMAGLGAAFAIFGMVSSIASSATKPAADTRAWASLPGSVYAEDHPIAPDAPIRVLSHDYQTGQTQPAAPVLDRSANGCRLILVSDAVADGSDTPAARLGAMASNERNTAMRNNNRRDAAMRQFLLATFAPASATAAAADATASMTQGK